MSVCKLALVLVASCPVLLDAAQCWKLSNTPCSTCGVSNPCTSIPCSGMLGYYCPTEAVGYFRETPATTAVWGCDITTSTGRRGCSPTNGPTTWCVGRESCSGAGNLCMMPPGGGARFCATGAGTFLNHSCGLIGAALSGSYCGY